MKRRLINLLAVLSLLLCVATVVLWVRSYSGTDSISRAQVMDANAHITSSRIHEIQCTRGQVRWLIKRQTLFFPGTITPGRANAHWSCFRYGARYFGWDDNPMISKWNRLGFATWESARTMSSFADSDYRAWAIPVWALTLALAVLPATVALGTYTRRRRRQTGFCIACGYDLRATPERCPECGTEVKATSSPAR